MLNIILFISSVVSISSVAALAYGYRSSLFSQDTATRWFAWSMALLAMAMFCRSITWDIISPVSKGGIDQRYFNVAYNIVSFIAAYAGLKARWHLIPEAERDQWHWYSAWIHPSFWKLRRDRPIRDDEERLHK